MTEPPTAAAALDEIYAFHHTLADWLAEGRAADLDSLGAALHRGLSLIDVSGQTVDRAALLDGLRRAGGSRPGLRIEITDAVLLAGHERAALVTFGERHLRESACESRRTTALLVAADHETRWLWRHVRETAVRSSTRPRGYWTWRAEQAPSSSPRSGPTPT